MTTAADKALEVWDKMNDSEQYGCQFGLFPAWVLEYKLTHEEIVKLMGFKANGGNINEVSTRL